MKPFILRLQRENPPSSLVHLLLICPLLIQKKKIKCSFFSGSNESWQPLLSFISHILLQPKKQNPKPSSSPIRATPQTSLSPPVTYPAADLLNTCFQIAHEVLWYIVVSDKEKKKVTQERHKQNGYESLVHALYWLCVPGLASSRGLAASIWKVQLQSSVHLEGSDVSAT